MNKTLELSLNRADTSQIANHLRECDGLFIPPLSERVEVNEYSQKIASLATRFEAWTEDGLAGLLAAYCNDQSQATAYITSLSVSPRFQGQGVAAKLLNNCISYLTQLGFIAIKLEVNRHNTKAMNLYEKYGFLVDQISGESQMMTLQIGKKRQYNAEIKDIQDHKYAYNFDFDVMHPYMVRSFQPFFRPGSLLELGSFQGDFTQRLLNYFDDITCVEASTVAIQKARLKLSDRVELINGLFETVILPKRYDNIVLVHVLEHLDDPVSVLKRINNEWLTETGRLFMVCPNAPSRQIAVKMGLISHNAAVTYAEAQQGHRCTYSLDTLERDAVAAGLNVVHRSGIFFKALANFQWDRLLQTDIISQEYLEGCYKLGKVYPDLCSSIFLLCESTR